MLETDQAAIFAEAMQHVQGFPMDAVGGAMWDEDTGKGTGKGASSSSCAAALAITNTMIKGKGKLNEQQKEAKKCKTVLTMVKTTIKDIDAALFNNGKVLKQKKKTDLLQHKQTLTAFF